MLRQIATFVVTAKHGIDSQGHDAQQTYEYLYHLVGLHIARVGLGIFGIAKANWVFLIVYSLISIVMAEISFRTLENWFLSYKKDGWGKLARA